MPRIYIYSYNIIPAVKRFDFTFSNYLLFICKRWQDDSERGEYVWLSFFQIREEGLLFLSGFGL